MLKNDVLAALKRAERSVSGAELSKTLGVSRAAVWKAVESLRKEGYEIEAQSAVGYRLTAEPDRLDPAELRRDSGVVGREVLCLDTVDSTNDEVKRRAMAGAAPGLVVTAEAQT
ncbi:MAG: HTH domain-containing protein, partial [Oscillospiraceae bacterium]